jgi:hypothetical protein
MLIEPVRELRAVCRHLRPGVILAFAPDELVRRTGGASVSAVPNLRSWMTSAV